MEDKTLFFPVEDVNYTDLYNWAERTERNKTLVRTINFDTKQSATLTDINQANVALFRYDDDVYAVKEKCPHAGGPLHLGDIEVLPDMSLCVRCPWHSWRFKLETGKVAFPMGRTDVQMVTYPVKVKPDGQLWVGFDAYAQEYFKSPEDFLT